MKLKFITLNVLHGGELIADIIDFLKKENPDVVVLQEVNNATDRDLPENLRTVQMFQEHFPDYHLAYEPALLVRYKSGSSPHGAAILSRFPILESRLTYLSNSYTELDNPLPGPDPDYSVYPKYMQTAVIETQPRLTVSSIHGIWDYHGDDTPARLRMSEIILRELDSSSPVVFAGDFNVKPNTKTVGLLTEKYNSVFGDSLTTTFNMKRKDSPGYATAAVDMIFVSHDIKVLNKDCPDVDVSDHLPLIATLEI